MAHECELCRVVSGGTVGSPDLGETECVPFPWFWDMLRRVPLAKSVLVTCPEVLEEFYCQPGPAWDRSDFWIIGMKTILQQPRSPVHVVTRDAAIRGDRTACHPAPRPERLHPVCLSRHVVRGPRTTLRVWTSLGRQSGAMAGFGVGQGVSQICDLSLGPGRPPWQPHRGPRVGRERHSQTGEFGGLRPGRELCC